MTIETIEKPEEQGTDQGDWLKTQAPEVQDYIIKLRKENAANRVKKNEIEGEYTKALEKAAELDKLKEEQAQKNGEFEKLYKQEKERADNLEGLSARIKAYEDQFTKQFEEVKDKLTEAQRGLIEDSGMSIEKKLEWAIKLNSEGASIIDSPSSERPGGSSLGNDSIIDSYNKGDMEVRAALLFETKKNNPKLYETLLHI